MRFESELVESLALVVRRGKPRFSPPGQTVAHGRAAWLDLFPKSDWNFGREFEPQAGSGKLSRVYRRWLHWGADGYDDLFVLAHGRADGLADEVGNRFALATSALPARVWLLACDMDAAMFRAAEDLLRRGGRTVIAATGKLDAPAMAMLVTDWVERSPDESLESWLLARRGGADAAGGIRALTIFGEVTLDDSVAARWNEMTWSWRRNAEESSPRLSETDAEQFNAALDAILAPAELWEATVHWLMPQVLTLAENRDHDSMNKLIPRCEKAVRRSPALFHALATSSYRCGYYDLMAKYIAAGLDCAPAAEIERAELLADLTSLLIDMNLPAAASRAADAHEQCRISSIDPRDRHGFKRLDWRSRIAFKRKEFDAAIGYMIAKRRQNRRPPIRASWHRCCTCSRGAIGSQAQQAPRLGIGPAKSSAPSTSAIAIFSAKATITVPTCSARSLVTDGISGRCRT